MADLNNLQAAQTIKIAGSDSSGVETTFINSTLSGEIKSADLINVSILQTTLSVSVAGAPIEVKVGASRLANRKSVQVQANGTGVVYGYSVGSQPFVLANGSSITISLGDAVGIWVDRASGAGAVDVIIAEFS